MLRSAGGALALASASAGDDLVARAASGVTVAGALTSGGGGDGAGLADTFLADLRGQAMTVFGHTYTGLAGGSPIDIVAASVVVSGSTSANGAGSDVRMVATGTDTGTSPALNLVGPVAAGRDVALDATGGDFSPSRATGSICARRQRPNDRRTRCGGARDAGVDLPRLRDGRR